VGGYLVVLTAEFPADITVLLLPNVLILGAGTAAVALMANSVQAEAARRKTEAIQLALTQAELRALRAQINPHFLFNTLNTILYFVRTDPATARRLLLNLSDIFQRALRSGEFVPLRDEVRYVEAYLTIEKARLDERLQLNWSLPEPDSAPMDFPVPTLILQPIVENAVVHGIAPKPEGGQLTIEIVPTGENLLLRVSDDGLGFDPASRSDSPPEGELHHGGIGLSNVERRLQTIYGNRHSLKIESSPGSGTRIEIEIPGGREV